MQVEPGMIIGMVYTVVAVPLVSYLLYTGKLRRALGWTILALSALMGFAFFAPMFPWQLQSLMLGKIPEANLPTVVLACSLVIASSLVLGRAFCGFACPPGALQELAYLVPVKKIKVPSRTTVIVRWAVFAAMLVAAVLLGINMMKLTGLEDLFKLALAPALFVFLLILAASTVVYRPFCRLICPFGALSSLFSGKSLLGVRRNNDCIECGRCEKACPSQALAARAGSECYLCGRCMRACHKDALRYLREKVKK